MAAWNKSSLAFSDHNNMRHDNNGLMKNTATRVSKRDIVEHKMFGSKRKNIQIGKTFRKIGKGSIKSIKNTAHPTAMKSKGISPSIDEFDKMMSKIVKKGSSNTNSFNDASGKKMFSRKSFG